MREVVTSLQNSHIKLAISLKQKKYRDDLGFFVVEGVRIIEDALKSDWQIEFCVCTDMACKQPRVARILETLQEKGCAVYQVTESLYQKVSDTQKPQGILVVMKKKIYTMCDLVNREENPMIVVLDSLQDPGNVGTIIRTVEAAGCTGIIMNKGTVDLFSGKTVRSTMGALFRLPIVCNIQVEKILEFVKRELLSLKVTALDETATPYFQVDFTTPNVLVIGNEGNGVQEVLLNAADTKLYIPMAGEAESLNASVAAAVIVYESVRQRKYK